ncbi:MAG: CDP-alcohol phosphatidyltransferase [Candidatus Fluviicola riflensis]|nr:MAG: CDP-alcohol phosphatidyltransferase [Candidatus Fluviicola riflensis]OGS79727.1 MAG: CDP-alcohol phosphatidyltransferase [Candidatus Fluviicola riflensis]OGS87160.1 MAG: CDP-alcohol phosphatidyltransferase [Fluviicola sp. RIFCSPHIGHO2_01_FULL_43_53]OGS89948.1 MAG: CDP-alcohol phosphatidyltransferase [Fluviicola sp. RIFCSPHIGHO2_12_FULL_43_24]
MNNERKLNVPNALSAYRILALPFIIWAIVAGDKQWYILLLSVNLITDILDGLIARAFKLETEFGARLDSLADIGTYLMAFTGMIVLENAFVTEYRYAFFVLMGMYALVQMIALVRFKRATSFHLYSSRIVGYVQGIFIFTYFVFGFTPWYFYLMLVLSYLAYLEAIIIVSAIPQLRSNVKGIYFILKEHKRIR